MVSDLSDDDSPGEIILAKARELGCDLIVMGAYGHSKMHEAMFGGTTRQRPDPSRPAPAHRSLTVTGSPGKRPG